MLLRAEEIAPCLQALNHWTLGDDHSSIHKDWKFKNFRTAMNFFAAVGELAESADHHPTFISEYTSMRVQLSTHDAKGLTTKDFELAKQIDDLVFNQFSGV